MVATCGAGKTKIFRDLADLRAALAALPSSVLMGCGDPKSASLQGRKTRTVPRRQVRRGCWILLGPSMFSPPRQERDAVLLQELQEKEPRLQIYKAIIPNHSDKRDSYR